ncbi:MAG: flagellar basal body P-ring protein FlgI [Planctomycetota bacterium]|nr:flagellar basal body P-ring protein FlgI [Planctomycetota bacterium]
MPPPPSFNGPPYLHGTIGSLASVRGFEPLLVSGYGLVVGLPGTGSADVPPYLRQWLIQEMRRGGMGNPQFKAEDMAPERVLTSKTAAPVILEGLIPPGAVVGTRFDVLVTALPRTQTTSLDGGTLYTFNLAVDGANLDLRTYHSLAKVSGPMYLNPFESANSEERPDLERQAVVVGGGVVTDAREIELILNTPSWQRSRLIADTINERFPHNSDIDREDVAKPITDQMIRLNVPARYAGRPDELISLINHLYIQRAPGFEAEKAQQLANLLVKNPATYAADVTLCWQTLGRVALPVIRRYYDHPDPAVRLVALDAGARQGDERTVDRLSELCKSPDPAMRRRSAEMLVHLPRSLRAARLLKDLLDDEERPVRVAAYETLAEVNDPLLQRRTFFRDKQFKFRLDLVPSDKPLIYISQKDYPRIAIFNPMVGFRTPTVAKLWDNRLMLKIEADDQPVTAYYQKPGEPKPQLYQFAPTVANLVFLLSHKPSLEQPTQGLDLNYSQVVAALSRLSKAGYVPVDVEVRNNQLATLIAGVRDQQSQLRPEFVGGESGRPETGDSTSTTKPGVESGARISDNAPRAKGSGRPETSRPETSKPENSRRIETQDTPSLPVP